MKAYVLADMTWKEIQQALDTVKIAIIPIGAHEQHGPHMVESCDAVLAEKMSIKLAERLHPYSVVAPTVNMGVSFHHLNFPGTISLKPETLLAVLRDMVTSLKHHGIQNFLLLNSHGGNQSTLDVASMTLSRELNVQVLFAKTTASAKKAMQNNIQSTLFGHSCEREVSEALYLAPQLVRFNQLEKGDIQEGSWKQLRPGQPVQGQYQYEEMTTNGCIGNAPAASFEIGKEIVEEALTHLTSSLMQYLKIETLVK
jgi:creatinine amidohydrolase